MSRNMLCNDANPSPCGRSGSLRQGLSTAGRGSGRWRVDSSICCSGLCVLWVALLRLFVGWRADADPLLFEPSDCLRKFVNFSGDSEQPVAGLDAEFVVAAS